MPRHREKLNSALLGERTGLVGSYLRILLISSVMFMLAEIYGTFFALEVLFFENLINCQSLCSEPVAVLRRNWRLIAAALGRCI